MKYKIHRKILDNKMRLMFVPMDNVDTVSIGIFVKIGSRYEHDDEKGIAHFLEHMMFKGTSNMTSNEISEKLDSVGAHYNAGTSYESTFYYMYGHKNNTDMFIDIMADMYINPVFNKEDILTERHVVTEELNMTKDDPYETIHEMMYSKLFSNSGLGSPIVGNKKNILGFTREDFINFRKNKYTTDRTVFVIVGNFNVKKISKNIIKKFEKVKLIKPESEHILMPYSPEIKHQPTSVTFKANKKVSQTQVSIAFRSENIYSEKSDVYEIIGDILGGGSSSRLYELLRNKLGITYFINVYNNSYLHEGLFVIHVGVDGKRINEVIKNIIKELDILVKKGVTDVELEKAKNMKITSFTLGLQTPYDIMNFYGMQELVYKVGDVPKQSQDMTKISTVLNKYKSITKKTVNSTIKELFDQDNMNIFVYGNKPTKLIKI